MATAEMTWDLASAREMGLMEMVWVRFTHHRLALAGLAVLVLLIALVILAPWVAPYDPNYIDRTIPREYTAGFAPPSAQHILGTDELNRDTLSRLLHAGRISLLVGFLATALTMAIGITIGALAGYYGGWVDQVLMRLADLVLSLPSLPLLLIMSAMLHQYRIEVLPADAVQVITMLVVLVFLGWVESARLMRGSILSLRSLDYVEAGRALGASHRRIILQHLIPNALPPQIVSATLAVGNYIVLESALSFLGVGINPPTASWGNMLTNFSTYMLQSPRMAVYPGLCIFLTVLCINFVGDGLRDALDPRMKV
jgi:peptide/nickel transport system permease protein